MEVKLEKLAALLCDVESRQLALIEAALVRYVAREGASVATDVLSFLASMNRAMEVRASASEPILERLGVPTVLASLREAISQANREAGR